MFNLFRICSVIAFKCVINQKKLSDFLTYLIKESLKSSSGVLCPVVCKVSVVLQYIVGSYKGLNSRELQGSELQ